MADALQDALRENVGVRSVLLSLGLAASLVAFLGVSPVRVGLALAMTAVSVAFEVVADAYGLRSEFDAVGVGVVALVGAAAILSLDGEGTWVAIPFAAAGGWILLDAVQTFRHLGLTEDDDARDGREVYEEYVTRRVDETLREQSMTRRELSEALDADAAAVDRALVTLDERGLLAREGSELRVDSPTEGVAQRVREKVRGALTRLARPLTIEFRDDAEDGGDPERWRPTDGARSGTADRRDDAEREAGEGLESTERR